MSADIGTTHTTIRVAINRVTHNPAKPGQYANQPGTPATKTDVEVVNLVTRVDGVSEFSLDSAISKVIKHLECERPDVCPEVKS